MEIIYTDHAKYRMEIRGITEDMVEKTLSEPEKTGMGYQNRFLAWKTFEKGRIKVVCSREDGNYIVISVMWE